MTAADGHSGDIEVALHQRLGGERSVGAIPLRHRGAHRHDRAARLDWVRGGEQAPRDPAVDDRVHQPLLDVSPADVRLTCLVVQAADLAIGEEGLLALIRVEADEAGDQGVETRRRILTGRIESLDALLVERFHRGADDRLEHLLFRAMVMVEPRHRESGARGDDPDRGSVIALLHEAVLSGAQDRSHRRRGIGRSRSGAHDVSFPPGLTELTRVSTL